jgi:hypothetical protein
MVHVVFFVVVVAVFNVFFIIFKLVCFCFLVVFFFLFLCFNIRNFEKDVKNSFMNFLVYIVCINYQTERGFRVRAQIQGGARN